ncbi:MAG: multicopper oxidase domain-containing protein [Desulfobulbaceae bacterium]|nr:multicopper oxidase domain-containing protein [Desulfobulbaceae bacterium]
MGKTVMTTSPPDFFNANQLSRIITSVSCRSFLFHPFLFIFFFVFFPAHAGGATVEYHLTIEQQKVNITGKPAEAMTINGSIPGPVLRFTEGDVARIHVRNAMDVETSIHWHGILVPPEMDGVPYISFPPIAPGTTFTYEFPIRQSGTYWYHSHTMFQEQSGMYGSIVIEPRSGDSGGYPEHVILFSDWTDEKPEAVNRTLKRGSEWYALAKGNGQSILGAARMGMLGSYLQQDFGRMPPMDISDVAYDRFLANGRVESGFPGKTGETIRLRIINGSATTYFLIEFAGGPMTIIAADGIDVQPVRKDRLLIAVAETYDVLVTLPSAGSFELRGTAHDGSGHAAVWIGDGPRRHAPDVPKPNLYHLMHRPDFQQIFALTPVGAMGMPDSLVDKGMFDSPGMMGMDHGADPEPAMDMGHEHSGMAQIEEKNEHAAPMNMQHDMDMHENLQGHAVEQAPVPETPIPEQKGVDRSGKKYGRNFGFMAADISSAGKLAPDGMSDERPWPPYAELKALKPTSFAAGRTVREIRLTLDGDMERFVWMLNNRTLSESDFIRIRKGEVVRFIMINRTMMHHPMHLHGHFFRVLSGQGDFAPLKHTVDVAPMSTTIIEFDANEVGDWFFHCHFLYHMEAGMARVVHYQGFNADPETAAVRPNLYKDHWFSWGEAAILTNMTEGMLTLSSTRNILSASWEIGWEDVDATEWEGIFTWERYFNRFFTIFAGVNLQGEGSSGEDTRGIAGFHYLLPLSLESRFWVDTDGGFRVSLDKSLELTPRFSFVGEVEYDSHDKWEGKVELAYLINKNFSLAALWHSEYSWGAGVQLRF